MKPQFLLHHRQDHVDARSAEWNTRCVVRESITWYQAGRPVLGEIVRSRLNVLEELRRLLLAIIPRERGKGIPRTK